ncbi:PDDEXK nuclease domain-containing protein [Yinghuangia seranimata]|uniref:PDDEXK nuclease domain-containing protein n=1 Tax=Yinghuangia seranimata TaxID=408067 RepID=UPI00248BEA61|nr:PDDEXK nuclease domain-containing protein [Yinghuangia seranimata]MDI2130333.1 PDDEXK nuclease domain-containing protein [Yinghuangia seranimata]
MTPDKNPAPGTSCPAELPPSYDAMLGEIKAEIATSQVRLIRAVNTELIGHYWRIGKIILARQQNEGWGAKVVNRLAVDLRAEYPGRKGFSRANLHYMRQFAEAWPEPIVQQPVGQLPWGHIAMLLGSLDTRSERDFYVAVVDDLVRDPDHDERTVGILIAAERNAAVVQYALNNSNQPMAVSTYGGLPPQMQALLPSAEDLTRVAHAVLDGQDARGVLPGPHRGRRW